MVCFLCLLPVIFYFEIPIILDGVFKTSALIMSFYFYELNEEMIFRNLCTQGQLTDPQQMQ